MEHFQSVKTISVIAPCFALMTQPDQVVYWLALRTLVLYRSHMDVDSVRSFVIPDVPKAFCQFLRRMRLSALRKILGGTVESVYITRQIVGCCQNVVRELCPAGKDPMVFLQE